MTRCFTHSFTRSAAVAQKLGAAGFQNIACITSGLQSVNPGTFDSGAAGKARLVTIQGKISAVLGTVLTYKALFGWRQLQASQSAYLFITFSPGPSREAVSVGSNKLIS